MRYAIGIESAGSNYSADVPDLPGCVATGISIDEVEREIRDAISLHLAGLRADGVAIPKPSSRVKFAGNYAGARVLVVSARPGGR